MNHLRNLDDFTTLFELNFFPEILFLVVSDRRDQYLLDAFGPMDKYFS